MVMFDAQQNVHLLVCCMSGLDNICILLRGHFDGLFLCLGACQVLTLSFRVLISGSGVLYYMLEVQLFLLPLQTPHRGHTR
jgi:hypothetical protein